MAGGQGINSKFNVFWVLRGQNKIGKKSLVYLNDDQQQSLFCFTLAVLIIIINIYLLSLCTLCICAKCRGRTLKVYVEDKCCVKYQTAHFEA